MITVTEAVLPHITEPAGLELRQRPATDPGPGQVRLTVEASGISFAEQSMRRGRYPGQPKFPFVPGYDAVGIVSALGPDVDPALLGQRVAVITKTGGWATHLVAAAADVTAVPEGVDPAEAETVVVNGVTAWQMLHRTAKVKPGQTILVHGANGGVGTTLVQLALHHGVRVIGTASPRHHEALRELGVIPLDYNDADLAGRVRELAPDGVDAAFDHLGGESLQMSFQLLAPHGTLVSYAIAAAVAGTGPMLKPFMAMLSQVMWWNVAPNGRSAYFYNLWAGHLIRPAAFRARTREDLTAVLHLLAAGVLTAKIAARMPLTEVRAAMELAESRTAYGKVVLIP